MQGQGDSSQPTQQVTFFLEGLFSWQKWRSKPENRTISRTLPSVFHVVVLVRPQPPLVIFLPCPSSYQLNRLWEYILPFIVLDKKMNVI